MGLEFRESLSINTKNSHIIKEGMVFNISPGFHNLENKGNVTDPRAKVYSIMVADTVVASTTPKTLTGNVTLAWDEISYFIDEDKEEEEEEEEKAPKTRKKKAPSHSLGDAQFGMRTTRARDTAKDKRDMAAEKKRKKHQEELERKKREEAAARFSQSKDGDSDKENAVVKDIMAFKSAVDFPIEARNGRIFVDQKREAVLLPIYGVLVPFHISTIKNATKSDDYLRINFITPGSTLPNDKLPKMWKDGKAIFVREMSFRFSDSKGLSTSLRLINELRKRASSRAHDSRVRDSLVAQEELILNKCTPLHPRMDRYHTLLIFVRSTSAPSLPTGSVHTPYARRQALHRDPGGPQERLPLPLVERRQFGHPLQKHQARFLPSCRKRSHNSHSLPSVASHHGGQEEGRSTFLPSRACTLC